MSVDASIDLSRYQTKELASTVAEILSVPESISMVLWTIFLALLVLVSANSMLYATGTATLLPWFLSTIYALVVASALGFVLGLIRVAGLMISRSERVLQLALETSQQVSSDYRAVRSGESRMPSSTEIVEHVYGDVVLPAMEAAVSKSLGIFGRPLLWIYRRTIGGCIRVLIARMNAATLTANEKSEVERDAARLMSGLADNQPNVEAAIQKAHGFTTYVCSMLRKMLLYPMQIVFSLVALIAVLPLGICWYLTR